MFPGHPGDGVTETSPPRHARATACAYFARAMNYEPTNGGGVGPREGADRRVGGGYLRSLVPLGCFLAAMLPAGVGAAEARDPLLELMIQKGMVTPEEATKVRAEADALLANSGAAFSSPPSSKWAMADSMKRLELFGDVRVRYEDRLVEDPKNAEIHLQRARYALRLGLRGEVYDDFYFGLRLETAANPRSPWVTMGTSTSSTSAYQGPFGKSTAGINLGQIYLGGRFGETMEVTIGKMANPLFTTPMVWDSDLAPEGITERFKYKVGQADFFATFGQFLYEDTNPTDTSGGFFGGSNLYPSQNGGSSTPLWLLAWQAGVEYHFTTNVSAKIAPVLYNYAGQGANTSASASQAGPGFNGVFVGQGATNGVNGVAAYGWSGYPSGASGGFNANQTGINDLLILEFPWEVNFKIKKLDARFFGDFAYNMEGSQRADAAYAASNAGGGFAQVGGVRPIASSQTHDVHAYLIGFAVGDLGLVYGAPSKKHDWEARIYWQHIEQYALDPNLLDSDFFEGRGNMEGIYGAFAYAFTGNMVGTLRYGYATRINSKLGTGGSNQDIPQMNPIQSYQIVQADLSLKF